MELAQLKQYANLPEGVPEAMLQAHLDGAINEVKDKSGLTLSALNTTQAKWWDEAVMNYCLSSLIPHLNTFYGDGASQAHANEGTVDYRWLSPDEVQTKVAAYKARFNELINRLRGDEVASTPNLALGAV